MRESRAESMTCGLEDITGQPWFTVAVETEQRLLQAIPEEDFHRRLRLYSRGAGSHRSTCP
jgi:hypothetical protein